MFLPTVLQRLLVILVLASASIAGVGIGAATAPGVPTPSATHTSATPPATVPVPAAEVAPASSPPTSSTSTTVAEDPQPSESPAHLVVDDGNQHLPVGTYSGSFELTNVGGAPAEWIWLGSPRISVSTTGGTLEPGQAVQVTFEIDSTQLSPGENLIANCIAYADGAVDVWITATKPHPHPTIPSSFTS